MTDNDDLRDQRLLVEVGQITHEYAALHRRTVRDLARTRAELERSERVLGTVAHDLRTPLTTIIGFTDMLLNDEELTSAQRDLSERANRAARKMSALTDELVQAVTLGGSPLRLTPVDVSQVVAQTVARHQLLQPPRGIRVVVDRHPTTDAPSIVRGDEAKLERLLDNLISNAVKFSPDGGYVHVSVNDDGRDAEIRVADEGPGLPAEHLEAIFSPFHRAPSAAKTPGVGLGLTIVKQITERHGGRVHVESALGAGAVFIVRLPITSIARPDATP